MRLFAYYFETESRFVAKASLEPICVDHAGPAPATLLLAFQMLKLLACIMKHGSSSLFTDV